MTIVLSPVTLETYFSYVFLRTVYLMFGLEKFPVRDVSIYKLLYILSTEVVCISGNFP
jgi:hypothetical protein